MRSSRAFGLAVPATAMRFACWVGLVAVLAALGCGSSNSPSAAPGDGGADGPSMAPVTDLSANEWVWVPVDGAVCRDGSPTGFAVNIASPASTNLMIYLEGGGACMDQFFCEVTPSTWGESQFNAWKSGSSDVELQPNSGVVSRTDTSNPMAGWNFVYVPYCTGDVFAGDNPAGMVPDVTGMQHFVGYTDVGLDLNRIVPTFPRSPRSC